MVDGAKRPLLDRRSTLRWGVVAGALALRWQSGPGLAYGAIETRAAYVPTFFSPQAFSWIGAACDRLIPADATGPGAIEAGVPAFIDRQMSTPWAHGADWYLQGPFKTDVAAELGYQHPFTPREIYGQGLSRVLEIGQQRFKRPFAELDGATRDDFLRELESGKVDLGPVPAAIFFSQLLQNTREGYFADPIHGGNRGLAAWKMIGFPGARADFMDFVNQGGAAYPYPPVALDGRRA